MDRSRSYSRHRPVDGEQLRSPSPVMSRDGASSTSSRGRATSRPRPVYSHHGSFSRSSSRSRSRASSESRSPTRREHRSHSHGHHHSHERHHEHHHDLIKTSAGLIAGLGLATVLARKVWGKDDEENDKRSSSRSRSKHDSHGHSHDRDHDHENHHHHHHHHHHQESSKHHHGHHHRRDSDVSSRSERMVDRARGTHAHDAVYMQETGALHRRDEARRMSLEPRVPERTEKQASSGRPPRPLPYPETPYPSEKFYEPRGLRASFSEPVAVSR
ncbi:hypothetical protein BGZ63DRAFT_393318 [Mariannaea sp. PMI_226]|nr:hypothetical protein BGZ63DRAFT_393318 [Mariannaea sp. PMI_226]